LTRFQRGAILFLATREAAMQKWEYLHLLVVPKGRKYRIDGVEQQLKENETLRAVMNRLGSDGWEMVVGAANTYWFKRPGVTADDESPAMSRERWTRLIEIAKQVEAETEKKEGPGSGDS
jgi:hypothetical protein